MKTKLLKIKLLHNNDFVKFINRVYKNKNLNHWDFMIRGPYRTNRLGHKTEWYNVKSK